MLPFRRGVDVYVLNDRDFDAILSPAGAGAGDLARQFQQTQVLVGFVKALGLGGPDFQLPTDSTGGTRSVLGLYDDVSKRISVRAGLAKPLQRRVLVHELTHALDDQHFSLLDMKRRMDPRTEQARAWQALIEGDAARVDRRYWDSLPAHERAGARADAAADGVTAAAPADAPFLGLVAFPYVGGAEFVQGLIDRRGMSAVNAAFRAPPTTSQEILHPDRFLRRTPSVTVRQPAADATPVATGVLGEIGLRLVLGETLAHPLAAELAAAWAGDHYVAWSDNDRTCVRVTLAMKTVGDAADVRDGLRQWATSHPGTDMRLSGNQTTITRCA